MIGLSLFLTPLIRLVPTTVLIGIFLYMGIVSLGGQQFIQRLMLFLMPVKHQPDYRWLRSVKMKVSRQNPRATKSPHDKIPALIETSKSPMTKSPVIEFSLKRDERAEFRHSDRCKHCCLNGLFFYFLLPVKF
jgi:hypothetical protein